MRFRAGFANDKRSPERWLCEDLGYALSRRLRQRQAIARTVRVEERSLTGTKFAAQVPNAQCPMPNAQCPVKVIKNFLAPRVKLVRK
ncbi:MAG: hypothetical protein F6J93_09560 [Oscillatoria sp. SIO1A7]|nr:hypothetical protein [Oscillatoria sp. SIO1A7]